MPWFSTHAPEEDAGFQTVIADNNSWCFINTTKNNWFGKTVLVVFDDVAD
jgi:hypothetical protein